MRKVIFGINTSLDGCCDHANPLFIPDKAVHDYFAEMIKNAGVLVYGRKTYELMVPFWPDMAKNHLGEDQWIIDFAKAFDAVEKVVFSRTLEAVEDKNSRLVRTDLKEEILRLKQQPGKDILLGGVDLPSQLMELGLVDEYHLMVHPVIAGAGPRLMEGMNGLRLKLVDTKVFESGCVAHHYIKQ